MGGIKLGKRRKLAMCLALIGGTGNDQFQQACVKSDGETAVRPSLEFFWFVFLFFCSESLPFPNVVLH